MHQPRPYGLFGEVQSDDDGRAVELLARRLTNAKTLGGLDSLRMIQTLPSGGVAIAQDMGGVFKVFIRPLVDEVKDEYAEVASKTHIPMLFSGRITEHMVKEDAPVKLSITEQTRRRLGGYSSTEPPPPKDLQLHRFFIPHGPAFSEFQGKTGTTLTRTQYTNQHPTWYSGAMAEVVQVVAGYGRSDDKLPTSKPKPGESDSPMRKYERKQMMLPEKWLTVLSQEVINTRLPAATGLPPKNGQIQFDYKYNRTHGVGFDDKRKPWLIQVAYDGVHAMPLPLVPATTSKAFRRYVTEVGDDEILWVLDRFGGMPSGEGFPQKTKGGFDAWVRAGAIIKICDVGDFYQHLTYSSACGWSFNSSGTEGFNTCYDYDDTEFIGYGLSYKLRLVLGSSTDDGGLDTDFHLSDPREAQVMDRYLGALFSAMGAGNSEKHRAIKYKLMRRLSVADVLHRAEDYFRLLSSSDDGIHAEQELEHWDNLQLPPIATHRGNVSRVGRGWLYHGAKFEFQPQIKFPDPNFDGCISHDFNPLREGRKSSYPRCDTVMFGYYLGDQLKTVRYFWDDRAMQEASTDFEGCMTVGAWEKYEKIGLSGLQSNFYTSDFDDRSIESESTKTTKVVGEDLGYDHTPWFSFDAPFWVAGTIWRNRYFTHKTNEKITSDARCDSAVCIPYLNRNSILYATKKSSLDQERELFGLMQVRDPNSYRFWTYDRVMHWAGSLPVMAGKPFPKNGSPVWVEMHEYLDIPCGDFADGGDWIGGLPANYTWLVHPQANVWNMQGGGGPPNVRSYVKVTPEKDSASRGLKASILKFPVEVNKSPQEWYFSGSPGVAGDVFYRDACKILAGKTTYANVLGDEPEELPQRKRFGHTRVADLSRAHFFIGVINE